MIRPLKCVGCGKIGGISIPGHVSIAGTIHGDARFRITIAAAQVRGVDQCGAIRSKLADKGVVTKAVIRGL